MRNPRSCAAARATRHLSSESTVFALSKIDLEHLAEWGVALDLVARVQPRIVGVTLGQLAFGAFVARVGRQKQGGDLGDPLVDRPRGGQRGTRAGLVGGQQPSSQR